MSFFSKAKEYTVSIEGMKCEHCAANVEKTLKAIKDIKKVNVDLASKKAIIFVKSKDLDALFADVKAKISEIGFAVTNIE